MSSSFSRRRVGLPLLALVFALSASEARAQPSSQVEKARALFNAGAQAYSAGKYGHAIEAFKEAHRLSKRAGLLFSIAQAHRRLYFVGRKADDLRAAVDHYGAYLRVAKAGPRSGEAADALAQLEPIAARLETAEPAPVGVEQKTSSQLMITSTIPFARLLLDGKDEGELPFISDVEPGKHRVEVRAPGYETYQREVVLAKRAIVPLDVALKPKPATLSITAPGGASVSVNGRIVGVAPLPPLKLAPGPYTISIGKSGRRTDTRRLELGRDEHGTLNSELATTPQRKVAWSAIAVGGGGLLAAGGFGAMAWVRQRDASSWLDERGQSELTGSDLQRYRKLRGDRHRFRNAAFATGGAGAAVGVIGLALFAFDRAEGPRGGFYEQAAPPSESDSPKSVEPSMEVSLGKDGLSFSVQREF